MLKAHLPGIVNAIKMIHTLSRHYRCDVTAASCARIRTHTRVLTLARHTQFLRTRVSIPARMSTDAMLICTHVLGHCEGHEDHPHSESTLQMRHQSILVYPLTHTRACTRTHTEAPHAIFMCAYKSHTSHARTPHALFMCTHVCTHVRMHTHAMLICTHVPRHYECHQDDPHSESTLRVRRYCSLVCPYTRAYTRTHTGAPHTTLIVLMHTCVHTCTHEHTRSAYMHACSYTRTHTR